MTKVKRGTANRWSDAGKDGVFFIPYSLLRHPNFTRLSPYGNKLIMDLSRQFTGFNNGYQCASWSLMKDAGWKSSGTLQLACLECEHYGLIVRSQQGGLNRPTLYALTWRRVDHKPEKPLEIGQTVKPGSDWTKEVGPFDWRGKRESLKRKNSRPAKLKIAA
ncbi:hypothetical protein [Lysobacter sp. A03]|uniref:hypothetical protein n=1 Tax=Lysobacter sp. A03 TaxID=1199154 RepID=UPI000B299AA7|nr:hypothetical protein [Lysobacter sp. A03]